MDKENIKDYILYDSERDFLTVRLRRRSIIAMVIVSAFFCIFGLFSGSYIAVCTQIALTIASVICVFRKTGKGCKNTYPEPLFVQGFHMCYLAVSFAVFAFMVVDFSGESPAMYKILITSGEILFLFTYYSVIFLLIKKGKFQNKKKTSWSRIKNYITVIVVVAYGFARVFWNNVPENKINEILIAILVLISVLLLTQTQDLLKYYFIKKYFPSTWVDSNS